MMQVMTTRLGENETGSARFAFKLRYARGTSATLFAPGTCDGGVRADTLQQYSCKSVHQAAFPGRLPLQSSPPSALPCPTRRRSGGFSLYGAGVSPTKYIHTNPSPSSPPKAQPPRPCLFTASIRE
ncbi:hypothetical protein R3P38DRAFT_3256541 [Favolaschia claudopus]|uniref:Uncharacterized protein n=1 Tax=Favolaschia claudopus TaxID=2862362 RepID=A0AAW0DH90_9AGAR